MRVEAPKSGAETSPLAALEAASDEHAMVEPKPAVHDAAGELEWRTDLTAKHRAPGAMAAEDAALPEMAPRWVGHERTSTADGPRRWAPPHATRVEVHAAGASACDRGGSPPAVAGSVEHHQIPGQTEAAEIPGVRPDTAVSDRRIDPHLDRPAQEPSAERMLVPPDRPDASPVATGADAAARAHVVPEAERLPGPAPTGSPAGAEPRPAAEPARGQVPPPHLPVPGASAAPAGEDAVEIVLQPDDIGQIRMTMAQEGDHLRVLVQADRADTLDMMRRHADQLGAEFRQAGFSGASLSFGSREGRPSPCRPDGSGGEVAELQPAVPATARPTSGLDRRI
uniref:Flagellar hook-length control protein-like C-terminal domain-containing protein n=1 Tax=Cereibacter sphaeroides (strain ATCC 17025 / ATH 2.4.3) TaxID=349102 RepID=A4WVS0_CERS5